MQPANADVFLALRQATAGNASVFAAVSEILKTGATAFEKKIAIVVRQNIEITGIIIGKEETELLQYADDMTVTLSDINSLQALLDLLDVYKNASGLTINYTKTEGMWIGSLRNNKIKPLGLKWPDEPIKALGVYYSYDENLLWEKNFIENLDKIKKNL